ncbi:MAG: metal-sulfur cluster assembly factor [Chloroflexota bacterium]
MTLTPEVCREQLKAVIDPEIFQNIVDLGLVYGIDVQDETVVDVNMTLTTPHCPMGPQILEDVEQTLQRGGASSVSVNLVWEPPWTPDAMTDDLKRELGILEPEPDMTISEPEPELLPPPPAKKKGLLSRLFGW